MIHIYGGSRGFGMLYLLAIILSEIPRPFNLAVQKGLLISELPISNCIRDLLAESRDMTWISRHG